VPTNESDDLIKEFLMESRENLDRLDQDFVALESNPSDPERLGSIFRTIHTLKSTCGYFEFSKLGALAHTGESLLSRLRDGTLRLSTEITTALLQMVDAIRKMLASIESDRQEGAGDHSELIQRLQNLEQGVRSMDTLPAAPPSPLPSPPPAPSDSSSTALPPAESLAASSTQKVSDTTLHVDLNTLDRLMNLVGELVLTRNQILERVTDAHETSLKVPTQQLSRLTQEIQEAVMKTRMQPVGSVWKKFPRLVRDLAVMCGKKVKLQMQGESTELDKTLLEAIKDPLTHLVRNAVDHGIEPEAERRARGKPGEGTLILRAFHETGSIVIEMADDGNGIDLARVKQKAIDQGILSSESAAALGDRDVMNFIFKPGFSTAAAVSSVSGRGVGMDVVKTNIEKIGGVIELDSKPGQGTTFTIRIPLTLAIISALIVTCRGNRYAIPQANLLEVIHMDAGQALENVCGAAVYRLRGRLLPVVYLDALLASGSRTESSLQDLRIVVLKAGRRRFGLVVEAIQDTEEVVVKPLARELKHLSFFAGATIMGDGLVALILDVMGLARQAYISTLEQDVHAASESPVKVHSQDRQTLLLLETSQQGRMAIPLSSISRLEKFSRTAVEKSGGQDVVQYQEHIIPLVYLSPSGKEALHVVVCAEKDRLFGLVVERILDIVEEPVVLQGGTPQRGRLGSAVLQGRVTDILDIAALCPEKAA
jgi:two-component system, chemotaxis family, sensor kinase CheA